MTISPTGARHVSVASGTSSNSIEAVVAAGIICILVFSGRWGIVRLVDPERFLIPTATHQWADFGWQLRVWACAICVPIGMRLADEIRAAFRAPTLLFTVTIILYGLTAASSPAAEDAVLFKLVDLTLLLVAGIFVSASSENVTTIKFFWSLSTALLAVVASYGLLTASGILSDSTPTSDLVRSGRLAVAGGGSNVFARLVGVLSLICMHHFISRKGPLRLLAFGGVVVTFGLVVASGSRGGTAAALAGWVFYALLLGRAFMLRTILVSAVPLMLVLYFLFLVGGAPPVYSSDGSGFAADLYERWVTSTLLDFYTSDRDVLAAIAYDMWIDHPVFGAGLAAFPEAYPHNLFLEIAAEGGSLCLTLLATLLFLMATHVRPSTPYARLAAASAGLSLVAAQFSGDIYDSRNVFLFGFLAIGATKLRV